MKASRNKGISQALPVMPEQKERDNTKFAKPKETNTRWADEQFHAKVTFADNVKVISHGNKSVTHTQKGV